MVMTLAGVAELAQKNGVTSGQSDAEIRSVITGPKGLGHSLIGLAPEKKQTLENILKLTDESFGGNTKAAMGFLEQTQGKPIAKLDFNELVRTGTANDMVELQKKNPAAFEQLMNGNYKNVLELKAAAQKAANGPAVAPPNAPPKPEAPKADENPSPQPNKPAKEPAAEGPKSDLPIKDMMASLGQVLDALDPTGKLKQQLGSFMEKLQEFMGGGKIATVGNASLLKPVMETAGLAVNNVQSFGPDGKEIVLNNTNPGPAAPTVSTAPQMAMTV